MDEILSALIWLYQAYYDLEYKTDEQFDAMERAAKVMRKYPDVVKRIVYARELL